VQGIVAVGSKVPATRLANASCGSRLAPADALDGVVFRSADRDGAFAGSRRSLRQPHRIDSAQTDGTRDVSLRVWTAENMLMRANVARASGCWSLVRRRRGFPVVQLAQLRGAHVIAVTRRKKARDVLAIGRQTVNGTRISFTRSAGNPWTGDRW
jgi:hypothetical protein